MRRNVLLKQHKVRFIPGHTKEAVTAMNDRVLITTPLSSYSARSIDSAKLNNEWPFSKPRGHENNVSVPNIELSQDYEALSPPSFSYSSHCLHCHLSSQRMTQPKTLLCASNMFLEDLRKNERTGEANLAYLRLQICECVIK